MTPAVFFVKYNNDVGPDDDYFREFQSIKYGDPQDSYKAVTIVNEIYNPSVAAVLVHYLNKMGVHDRFVLETAIEKAEKVYD